MLQARPGAYDAALPLGLRWFGAVVEQALA